MVLFLNLHYALNCSRILNLFLVFTASSDGQVRAWEVQSGSCKKVFKGHDYSINCMLVSKLFVEFVSMVTIICFHGDYN